MGDKLRNSYDVQRETNEHLKSFLDALVEVNAYRYHAEELGWVISMDVDETGNVNATITRTTWPTFSPDEESA